MASATPACAEGTASPPGNRGKHEIFFVVAEIRRAVAAAGRLDSAVYVERGTMADGQSIRLADKTDDVAPYFALVLVPGWSTRP